MRAARNSMRVAVASSNFAESLVSRSTSSIQNSGSYWSAAIASLTRVESGVRSTARSSTAVALSRWPLSSSASPTMPSSSADAAGLFSSISPSFATISWRPSSPYTSRARDSALRLSGWSFQARW